MDIILELMNGQIFESTLATPFRPESNELEVLIGESGKTQKFLFLEICSIQMHSYQSWMFLFEKDTMQEEVTTFAGETYLVHVAETQPHSTGFFGLLVREETPYRLIFFTSHGVKARCQTQVIGEILQAKGAISSDSIQHVVEEQKILKQRRIGEIIADNENLPQHDIEHALADVKRSGKVPPRAKVGEILIAAGLVTQEQVDAALEHQDKSKKKKIGQLLIEHGFITEDQLLVALATKFQLTFIDDLTGIVPDVKALEALPADIVRQSQVFPVADNGGRLVIATSEPTNYSLYDQLQFYTGRKIEMMVARSRQIAEAIDKHYLKADPQVDELLDDLSVGHEVEDEGEESQFNESDSQIVNLVNRILIGGHDKGASDIHFEPGLREQPFQVRYRIDGVCQVVHQILPHYKRAILSRLKIMANLDITERRRPQSGKFFLKFKNDSIEFRMEVTPTAGNNEDAVLRILASSKPLPLNKMNFSPLNEGAFRAMLTQPYGIILCVGPTGSGKTTTLHSALGHINTPDRKIWTAEDPVEITQPGLRQVQIQSRIGLTFAEVLRSFLRADPDVIMIGEMRDKETARIAIEASLTGHLVLSTLHTNSAPETLVRLSEMELDPYNFADALLGILAQRLARRLCESCRTSYHPSEEEFADLVRFYESFWFTKHKMESYSHETTLMRKGGCEKCGGTGYRGRIALHEMIVGTERMKTAIKKERPVEEIRTIAIQDGMRTLLMDGVQKIFQGLTDLSQVLKVCASQKVTAKVLF